MGRSVNRITLLGNLGADPELRQTNGGTPVTNVNLATSRRWTDGAGEEQERVQWHRLVFWDRYAEIVNEYAGKGSRLYVEGRLEYSTYEQDGVERTSAEIRVQDFVFLDNSPNSGHSQRNTVAAGPGLPAEESDHRF